MTVREINREEELVALKPRWNELVKPEDPFWLQYEWFYCWFKSHPDSFELAVYVVSTSEHVEMIAPLFLDKSADNGHRTLRFAANDFPNEFIGNAKNGIPELIHYFKQSNSVAKLWLRHVRPNSQTGIALKKLSSTGTRVLVESGNDSPYFLIAGTWEEYFKVLSTNFRRTLKNKKNRLAKKGRVEIRRFNSPDVVAEGIDHAFQAADRSWQGKQGSAISSLKQRTFYEEFAGLAAEMGWLELFVLELDGTAIAFEYNLLHGEALYSLKWGYDEAYHEFSPGALLKRESTEIFFRANVKEVDLLGSSDFFKKRWTKHIRPDEDVTIFLSGWKPGIEYAYKKYCVPALRRSKVIQAVRKKLNG